MRVRFTSIKEFLEELTRDAHLVEDGMLRLTQLSTPIPLHPLAVLAVRAGVMIHHKLVELHLPIGWVSRETPPEEDDAKVQKVAQYLSDRVATEARALGLTVRPGRFLP
jgi:hypothetical protein